MTYLWTEFFECDNPKCQLRFPVYEGGMKPKRCPICRSSIHLAIRASNPQENILAPAFIDGWNVEVVLDNIRSAWNVGAILRTSDGLGIRKAYCCGITPSPVDTKVSKTALGAEISVPCEGFKNGVQLAASLKSTGYAIWALEDFPGACSLYSVDSLPKDTFLALVVGNENSGIDPAIIEQCDKVISIPMMGCKQSYNVAVAFGIAVSFLLYRHSVSQGSFRILPST